MDSQSAPPSSSISQKSAPLPSLSPLHLGPPASQVNLQDDQNESDRLLMKSLSFLLKDDNYLTRCLLQIFLTEENLNEKIVGYLIDLHGSPTSLFLSCLSVELSKLKDLSLLMRERSESVCVLQSLWAPLILNFEQLCDPLSKLGDHLSKRDVGFMLGTEDPTEKALSVKDKIVSIVKNVLKPNKNCYHLLFVSFVIELLNSYLNLPMLSTKNNLLPTGSLVLSCFYAFWSRLLCLGRMVAKEKRF